MELFSDALKCRTQISMSRHCEVASTSFVSESNQLGTKTLGWHADRVDHELARQRMLAYPLPVHAPRCLRADDRQLAEVLSVGEHKHDTTPRFVLERVHRDVDGGPQCSEMADPEFLSEDSVKDIPVAGEVRTHRHVMTEGSDAHAVGWKEHVDKARGGIRTRV